VAVENGADPEHAGIRRYGRSLVELEKVKKAVAKVFVDAELHRITDIPEPRGKSDGIIQEGVEQHRRDAHGRQSAKQIVRRKERRQEWI